VGDTFWSLAGAVVIGLTVNCPERPETVLENLKEIGPHVLVAPPRIWENLVSLVQVKMEDASFVKRRLYRWLMPVGEEVARRRMEKEPVPPRLRLLHALGEFFVFAPLRDHLAAVLLLQAERFLQRVGVGLVRDGDDPREAVRHRGAGDLVADLEDEAEEPHPDRDGEAEQGNHGGDGPAEMRPHVGPNLAELRGDLGPKLGNPLVHSRGALVHLIEAPVHLAPQVNEALAHLIEAPVHVGAEVVEALVQVVDPLGELLAHESRVRDASREVKEGRCG
jgi:hypothetical protein